MKLLLAVALGGAIGAVARYQTVIWVTRWSGSAFPLGTLAVNVAGAFTMGACIELLAARFPDAAAGRAFATAGVLGAFTTFSAFALDAVVLVERGAWAAAAAYVVLSLLLSILALGAGLWTLRALLA